MTKTQIIKAMANATILGKVSGHGDDWDVEVLDEESKDRFVAQIASVRATRTGAGTWVLRPMKQGGLPFGTLDSAEQGSLFDFNHASSKHHY